jgi:hypothetical protein
MSAMDHMANALSGWGLWIALVGACLGTYFCRAIGVMLSQNINQDSESFVGWQQLPMLWWLR